jgi:hypothetical protein
VPKGNNRVLKAQKTIFSSRHGLCDILFLSLGELGKVNPPKSNTELFAIAKKTSVRASCGPKMNSL